MTQTEFDSSPYAVSSEAVCDRRACVFCNSFWLVSGSQTLREQKARKVSDKLKKDRDAKLGLYVLRAVNSVVQTGDFLAVIYDTKFEKEDAVTLRIVFRVADPHEVSGLWFNK